MHNIAHITGGGPTGNIPRVMPAGLEANVGGPGGLIADFSEAYADQTERDHAELLAAIERGVDVPPLPESFYQPISRRPPRTGSIRPQSVGAP